MVLMVGKLVIDERVCNSIGLYSCDEVFLEIGLGWCWFLIEIKFVLEVGYYENIIDDVGVNFKECISEICLCDNEI